MPKIISPETEKALSLPVGVMSPLWLVFAGAATAGAAYFWARHWLKPTNIEAAMAPAAVLAADTVEPLVEAIEEAVKTAAEDVAETVAVIEETVVEVEAAAPEPEAAPEIADDLTKMTGIGPKLAQSLAERGVTRFAQIAAWTADDIAKLDREMKLMGRVEREAWVAQAKRYAEALH